MTVDLVATDEAAVQTRKMFFDICHQHKCKVGLDEATGKIAILGIDIGRERVLKGVSESLVICGFGTRALKWDWHVVVLRRGRSFLTMYILVVHAPYPGLWVIVEREHIADQVEDCVQSFMMIGEDVAPFSTYTSRGYIVQRGLWTKEMMRMYMGFTEHSNAIMQCLNLDIKKYGPLLTDLLQNGFITVDNIQTAFVVQKRKITAKFAQNLLELNQAYLTAQLADNKYQSLPGATVVDLARYGSAEIFVSLHTDKDDEEGQNLEMAINYVDSDSTPCIVYYVVVDELIKVKLYHNAGGDATAYEENRSAYFVYVNDSEQEDPPEESFVWKKGCFFEEAPYPLQMSSDESENCWIVRDHADSKNILKVYLKKQSE